MLEVLMHFFLDLEKRSLQISRLLHFNTAMAANIWDNVCCLSRLQVFCILHLPAPNPGGPTTAPPVGGTCSPVEGFCRRNGDFDLISGATTIEACIQSCLPLNRQVADFNRNVCRCVDDCEIFEAPGSGDFVTPLPCTPWRHYSPRARMIFVWVRFSNIRSNICSTQKCV